MKNKVLFLLFLSILTSLLTAGCALQMPNGDVEFYYDEETPRTNQAMEILIGQEAAEVFAAEGWEGLEVFWEKNPPKILEGEEGLSEDLCSNPSSRKEVNDSMERSPIQKLMRIVSFYKLVEAR